MDLFWWYTLQWTIPWTITVDHSFFHGGILITKTHFLFPILPILLKC